MGPPITTYVVLRMYNTCRGVGIVSHMARNDARRTAIADAGISVLADGGARALTHRAVDRAAKLPTGTTSNYFATRQALTTALVDRIADRLTPDASAVASERAPDATLVADYLLDVVSRLTAEPDVALALFELRLEAVRRPEIASILGAWRQRAFDDDVAFHRRAGLPGGPREIALFHYAIDGLMLDRLTIPLQTEVSTEAAVDAFASRLLSADND